MLKTFCTDAGCYFDACGTSLAPSAATVAGGFRVGVAPPAASEKPARALATHGSWSAVAFEGSTLILDEFGDGSCFAIVVYCSGSVSLMLSSPNWRLKQGREFAVKADIDGQVFSCGGWAAKNHVVELDDVDKSLLQALYKGREARIIIEDDVFEINTLQDAALTIDDAAKYLKTASL
jgi:hypothetical protein